MTRSVIKLREYLPKKLINLEFTEVRPSLSVCSSFWNTLTMTPRHIQRKMIMSHIKRLILEKGKNSHDYKYNNPFISLDGSCFQSFLFHLFSFFKNGVNPGEG